MFERPTTTARLPARSLCHFANQDQAAQRRAGNRRVLAEREPTGVDRVEAIDILGGIDRREHRGAIHAGRQRQLHQDAVHVGLCVQLLNQCDQLGRAGGGRQAMIEMFQTRGGRLFGLAADIHLAGRIVADQHHGQAWNQRLPAQARPCARRCGRAVVPRRRGRR